MNEKSPQWVTVTAEHEGRQVQGLYALDGEMLIVSYGIHSKMRQLVGMGAPTLARVLLLEFAKAGKPLYGNLPFTATQDGVRTLFTPHGTVEKISLIADRDAGRARGFGFVEMADADASRAMQAPNGTDLAAARSRLTKRMTETVEAATMEHRGATDRREPQGASAADRARSPDHGG